MSNRTLSDLGRNGLAAGGGFAAGQGLGNAMENRPQDRGNWQERSQNRNDNWQNRVDQRNDAWQDRSKNREQARNDFQKNQDKRWNEMENRQQDRQNWRDQSREDWQKNREDMWDYRADRAEQVWDNAGDFYDDCFDDHWWGNCYWGSGWGYGGSYVSNPWWWWGAAAFGTAAAFVAIDDEPYYADYGMNVVYEGDTVYVDNQPVPAQTYQQSTTSMAKTAAMPPPPLPPAEGKPAEWMPLGVFALAQEEKGDPVMFFQISINKEGVISGGYTSTLTQDERPIAGQIDKKTQIAAWRIGENRDTIFTSSLANLTKDVSPIALNFKDGRTQTWLLVRIPEPAEAGKDAKIPTVDRTPPPLKKTGKPTATLSDHDNNSI